MPVSWVLKDALGANISSLTTLVKMESVFNGAVPAGGCVASSVGTKALLYSPATGATGGSDFRLVSGGYTIQLGFEHRRQHRQGLLHGAC